MTFTTSFRRHVTLVTTGIVLSLLFVAGTAGVTVAQDKAAAEKYNEGLAQLKEKNYETALNTFLEARNIAEEAGDQSVASKAMNYAYRLAYNVGVGYVKQDNFETALDYFNRGIELEPDYYKNYKGKAAVHKELGNIDEAMEAYVKTAQLASEAGELDEREKAWDQAEGFVAKALQEKDYAGVVDIGSTFLNFGETANVHYYVAHAHNQLGNYEQALSHADQALELERGSRAAKAKIHFEKGEAHKNLSQYDQAHSAYTEASYGDFKKRAEHEIEVLRGSN